LIDEEGLETQDNSSLEAKRNPKHRWLSPAIMLVVATYAIILLISFLRQPLPEETANIDLSNTPERFVPTRTASVQDMAESLNPSSEIATPISIETPELSVSPTSVIETPVADELPGDGIVPDLSRFGMTGGIAAAEMAYDAGLPFSHLLNWHVVIAPPQEDYIFWQMVRLGEEGIRDTSWEQIHEAVEVNPGSYWLVGNEPDVKLQDNVTPERYAELYHEVYSFIKERDPSAQLVIGGVSQPTPLRRAYLDIVLDTYRAKYGESMPIDIWNVHAFILREEADSWGVEIPPGMEGQTGILYEIEDHNDIEILRQNLIDFRGWMSDRGYGDKPLVISEYGILMPEDYGFSTEVLGKFLTETFDLFLTEANEMGYAPDGNRLVQWWFWYIVYEEEYYPTGSLYDVPEERFTPLGEIWTEYLKDHSTD